MEQEKTVLNITLHKNQQLIHNSTARFKAVDAGKRFGKTKWLLYELIRKAHEKEGEYWYIGPTYKQAKTTVWNELKKMIPQSLIKGKSKVADLEMPFKCGSSLFLKGADDPDSLRGPEIDGAGFDERSYQPEEIWSRIIRGQLTKRKGFAYFISSPNFRGRNHWTRFCEEVQRRQMIGDKDYAFWHFTIHDNPELPKDEIKDLEASVPSYIWDLEFLAKTSNISGQLYGEFNFDRDVVELKIADDAKRYRGLDHGLDHPEACLWATVDMKEMVIYVYDEYVRAGCTISQNCEMIKSHTGSDKIEWTVIDPSTAKRDANTKKTYMFEYSFNGVPCMSGERSQRGVDLLKMCLERGRVKVHPKCRTLIYQLQNVQFGDKLHDDACDALKYLVTMICDTIPEFRLTKKHEVEERTIGIPKGEHLVSLFDEGLFPQENKHQELSWLHEEVS